jgi:hypothetical protein
MKDLIPFRVMALPPRPETGVMFRGMLVFSREKIEEVFHKLQWKSPQWQGPPKVWLVVGLKMDVVVIMLPTGAFNNEQAEYALLVREGETPVWWPLELCEVAPEKLERHPAC